MSMNSHFFFIVRVNSPSYTIHFCPFIHSFNKHWQKQASVTALNGNVINTNLIITLLKDSVFIFYISVFFHIVGSQKKIQLYFTYLFSCHLWQIFNLLLNDIYGLELACFCVLHTHWGPSMHWQYVCMLIKVPLGNEITCETHFLFSSKLHNILLGSILWIDF